MTLWCPLAVLLAACVPARGEAPVVVRVDPSKVLHSVTPHLTGTCIEDVNHEIYGGLYSQMIFGESFQEQAPTKVDGFIAVGGAWSVRDGVLHGGASSGGKLLRGPSVSAEGVRVEINFPTGGDGNAGLIFDVAKPASGADAFSGYEVSLDPDRKVLRLARHDQDYRLLRDVPCDVARERWTTLAVSRHGESLEVSVDGKVALKYEGADLRPTGVVGVRTWQRAAQFRDLSVTNGGVAAPVPFASEAKEATSGMWRSFARGGGTGTTEIITDSPFVGAQSQRLTADAKTGEFGIENRGLNRRGMSFVTGQFYAGHIWAKAKEGTEVSVSLAAGDGSRVCATSPIAVSGAEWKRYDFTVLPNAADAAGRFEISLKSPGSVTLGYAFLEPRPSGTFGDLPVRADVAKGLMDQGVVAMRYGGSMVNNAEYRWKKMIGERDRRPPYRNCWYPHSTNGWGIIDFLDFAEAAHIFPVPDFNVDESPADMVDFLEYANGDASTPWGAKRAAGGHPAPYRLTHLELGNEERVDESYFQRFEGIARAIWTKDPKIVLTVGDFTYTRPIADPYHFDGADSHITTLAAHKKILDLAREFGAEVWFDIHVWTDAPVDPAKPMPWKTYVDAIDKIAGDAKHHVVIFELNANSHGQLRALANAQALMAVERDGRLPFVSSANCLQVDGQNDNGWDQGLLFLNPSQTWLQPPGMVWQMAARSYQPNVAQCAIGTPNKDLDAVATTSDDGRKVTIQLLNLADAASPVQLDLAGWDMAHAEISAQTLAASLDAANTAATPTAVQPVALPATSTCTLPPHSFTVVRIRRS